MTNRAHVLLWTDSTAAYLDAIKAAGLADRVAVDTLAAQGKAVGRAAGAHRGADGGRRAAGPAAGDAEAALGPGDDAPASRAGWRCPICRPTLTLTCARGTHPESMPENIIGALFYVAKPYAAAVENQKSSKWVHTVAQPLTGKTLGILGLGAIGQEVARIAVGFGMRVIGTKRRPEPMAQCRQGSAGGAHRRGAGAVRLRAAVAAGDAGDRQLHQCRTAGEDEARRAWLLNFGRGHLIKDDDLIAAVNDKKIAGAVLDVFRQEPLPAEHPFWTTEGILVLPHIGGPHPQRDRFVASCSSTISAASWTASRSRKSWIRTAGY